MPITSTPLTTAFYSLPEQLFGMSVQPNFKYIAAFIENPFNNKKFSKANGPMPIIAPWQFQSITIPSYKFSKETVMYGQIPRSFPILNFKESLEISIKFLEDENGTIDFFKNWCASQIIDRNGFYVPPAFQRISSLTVEIQDRLSLPVVYYVFRNLFFIDASDLRYSYENSDVITCDFNFSCEILETYYTKAAILNTVQSKIGSLI